MTAQGNALGAREQITQALKGRDRSCVALTESIAKGVRRCRGDPLGSPRACPPPEVLDSEYGIYGTAGLMRYTLQGSLPLGLPTQGVALGFPMSPRRGSEDGMHKQCPSIGDTLAKNGGPGVGGEGWQTAVTPSPQTAEPVL